jgi:hypothetical protein
VKGAQGIVLENAGFSPVFCRHIGCSLTVNATALESKPMKANTSNTLRHNFAIWVMGRRPGWFKPQRYMYRCLRCKWAFVINDERRGSVRVAADSAGELTRAEEVRRIATFTDGPCPGYQHDAAAAEASQAGNVIPLRRENRSAKASRDARAI